MSILTKALIFIISQTDLFDVKRGRPRHGYARTDPRRNHTGWWARVSVYRHGTRQGSGDGAEAQGQHDDGGAPA